MKEYLKTIAYPLICFFSLILSLVILAKLAGNIDIFFSAGNSLLKLRFLSLVIYVLLIVAGGYLLTESHNFAACVVAGFILVFSICYLILQNTEFTLLIYYFFYAILVAAFGMSQLKKE